ncbi:GNAT family N-acetyltransferase [Cellulomonas sp. WB94]|uniref:GNAT family N-acetyltransferase n=1 Tax=Cellulomonas sp. WB94 TaxID=2173174 RepID=UPI000D574517|nr:GNAT family N-acetyltransferase [Cellulomonas sp. WB94]PVU83267.1 GNAT family N-acetyltransferase [Cellulomonas sp. WB94]
MTSTRESTTVELRPFGDDDVAPAGLLLAARHRAHVRSQPLLAASGTAGVSDADPTAGVTEASRAAAHVAELWTAAGVNGWAAEGGDGLCGYLIGMPRRGAAWGPNMWVEAAGHAVTSTDLVAPLYARASESWVADGIVAHYAVVPAHDRTVLDEWAALGFGGQHVHGIRSVDPGLDPVPASGVEVRRARSDDADALAELDLVPAEHQSRSPVFSAAPVPDRAELRAEWATGWADERYPTFVAVRDGVVVGATTCCLLVESSMHLGPARPDGAAFLGFAAVLPAHRGHGVARSLIAAVLDWSRRQGCSSLVIDWRSTNRESSRTWRALGFSETFRRLHRHVAY